MLVLDRDGGRGREKHSHTMEQITDNKRKTNLEKGTTGK